jgi:hypothetical protein
VRWCVAGAAAAPAESISKRAPSTTRRSLRFEINGFEPSCDGEADHGKQAPVGKTRLPDCNSRVVTIRAHSSEVFLDEPSGRAADGKVVEMDILADWDRLSRLDLSALEP